MEFKDPTRYPGNRPARSTSEPSASPFRSASRPFTPKPASQPSSSADEVFPNVKTPLNSKQTTPTLRAPKAFTAGIQEFKFTKKSLLSIGSVVVGVVIIVSGGVLIYQHNASPSLETIDTSNKVVNDLEYQTLLPAGKSITDLGGWKRVSPTKSDPVYAYTDTIGEISISVSQQPLPKSFVGDTDDEVAELAKKFNATTKIDADGVKMYVGSSAKGPQSAIFTKNSLLILIKSQEKIEDSAWAKYAKSLN